MSQHPLFLIGTYTSDAPGGSAGIYRARYNPNTGELEDLGLAAVTNNPTFLAKHPGLPVVYAVNEEVQGRVSSFRLDPNTGGLTLMNSQPALGAHPCHVIVSANQKAVLVANYSSGTVCSLPIQADGSLGIPNSVHHYGRGLDPARQDQPHAHSVTASPDGQYYFAADLGLDCLFVYTLSDDNRLEMAGQVPVARGAGPRHLAFHPSLPSLYVVNELNSTVSVFDLAAAAVTHKQTLSTLPKGYAGANSCADLHVHPSGKFLYASNRGHDSIAVYAIGATGELTAAGQTSTQGGIPRNFALDAEGRWLWAENQAGNSIVAFSIDQVTGGLTPTRHVTTLAAPVCMIAI